MKRLLLLSVLAAALVAVPAAFAASATRAVTVTGHGVVTVAPNQVTIDAGVTTTADSAKAALANNATAMTKVIAALKQVGYKTLQTQQVSLNPITNAKGKVTGYTAQDIVTVTGKIASAGDLIDAAVGAGANNIDGPTLGVSNQNLVYNTALQRAVVNARAKAKALAHAGGFKVGRVLSISEQSSLTPITFNSAPAAAKSPSTPVVGGTQQVTADVQITFAIA
ncbi:MAG TPA: SIMPL domain-containing protein [Gaiellaceae bacterium]